MSLRPPKHAQILVVGGGPSGAYAAACLAREGFHVVILEAAEFPRYHIGESLLPSVRHHLRFIGADDKVDSFGFFKKPGAAIKFNQFKQEAYTDFLAMGPSNYAWNVTRSEFDKILLDHAETTGVQVFQSTKVTSLSFSGARPISAEWTHGPSSQSGIITFDYLVDASGRAGLMSSRYLKNRRFNESLKNVAMWAYWQDTDLYAPDWKPDAEGAVYLEALSDESGWAWFIPLSEGLISVGVVRHQSAYSKSSPPNGHDIPQSSTPSQTTPGLDLVPGLKRLLGSKGKMVRGEGELSTVRTASDYSYSASSYAGENYRMVGDAAAFIDPFFSSGVHLALTSGLSAAGSIAASIRGDCPESDAAEWHTQRVGVSYTRFLLVVLGAYKQIRAQSEDVLSDVGENNFDKAFNFLRPVIQGNADLGPRLSESEVQNALDFCVGLFKPVNPGVAGKLRKHLGNLDDDRFLAHGVEKRALLDITAPPLPFWGDAEVEVQRILEVMNARRLIHREHAGLHCLEEESLGAGYRLRLECGRLGLVQGGAVNSPDA
ncbi:FAD/NAD(P)-binding domain-containing protein [Russula aff. rugulosa BPL654]|nr:FAD/NAD(P)-binding domain-containing protein [Russula aff. rugulosa BPL654]